VSCASEGFHGVVADDSVFLARDSKRLSKMIKSEGKTEAAAVKGAIKELESLQKVQRAAHGVRSPPTSPILSPADPPL
jgi:hypothetical protein